jgi:hypothetical protein
MTDIFMTIANPNPRLSLSTARSMRVYVIPLMVFIVGSIIPFLLLNTADGFAGTDDYYHTRIADQIIVQGNLRLDFPWLPLTILNQDQFVDHHLLYHLYLSPWIHWGGVIGVKIAQSLVLGAITLVFWSLLRYLQVQKAMIWTVALLAISSPFLYRMLMIRTQAMAILLLLMTLHVLFRKQYYWLAILAFAFTWLYNGFIFLPAMVILYAVSAWVSDRQLTWQPVVFAVGGMLLGLIINPYFPQNISFVFDHLGEKIDLAESIKVGSEWYPYTTAALLEHSLGAMLAMVIGILASGLRHIKRDRVETFLLMLALLTLYMLFRSRRFIEYFPIFSLLFCTVVVGRKGIQWDSLLPRFLVKKRSRLIMLVGLLFPLIFLTANTLSNVYDDLQNTKGFDYMAGASDWLTQNTEEGSLVFQTDWDDFPSLFFHNTYNTYLVGLDTTYLQLENAFYWNQWLAITRGLVERPSVVIQETFKSEYAVSDTRHEEFAKIADADPNMKLVYRDSNSLIWQIISN